MVERELRRAVRAAARKYPIVTLTGPRQSGKTTLARHTYPHKPYVSLEPLDTRDFAASDPRAFLAEHSRGAIIDEVQHVPELLSYLQTEVDERPHPGRFILTGSQNFSLSAGISQSLAGRTAVLHLLPLSLGELRLFPRPPKDLLGTLLGGSYPRIHDRHIPAGRWLADYVATYVERDVRQILRIPDLSAFTTFLRLCAGRTAQELNLSALGADAGISHNTARAWLSVLETSFLCLRLPAWHVSLTRQAVKAPKLHFLDSGLVCHLLGIRTTEELRHHPLRGAIFESWVAAEVYKARVHAGLPPNLHHFRDAKGLEVDLLLDAGDQTILVESKSGATVAPDSFDPLGRVAERFAAQRPARATRRLIVYGGDTGQRRSDATLVPWHGIDRQRWT